MASSGASNFIHVVAAIIWHRENKNTLLISRRKKGTHLADYWELPGGKMEANETRLQALSRELKEELGITPIDSKAFMQVKHQYDDRNVLLDVWMVNSFSGEVSGCESQEICWMSLDDLDAYRFPEADIPVFNAITNNAIT